MEVKVKMCYICREEEQHDRTLPIHLIIQLKSYLNNDCIIVSQIPQNHQLHGSIHVTVRSLRMSHVSLVGFSRLSKMPRVHRMRSNVRSAGQYTSLKARTLPPCAYSTGSTKSCHLWERYSLSLVSLQQSWRVALVCALFGRRLVALMTRFGDLCRYIHHLHILRCLCHTRVPRQRDVSCFELPRDSYAHISQSFDLVLTDDPSNWPWHAFINLPLVPMSLIISRTNVLDGFPLVPLFLAWTTSPPVQTTENLMTARWRRASITGSDRPWGPILSWPPSPLMVSLLFPTIMKFYRSYFGKLRQRVMGQEPTTDAAVRRYVWALNDDRNVQLQVDVNAIPDLEQVRERRRQNANQQGEGNGEQNEENQDDPPQDPAAAAERTIRVTTASLGRFVGGALLIPKISNWMGAILFRLSKYSFVLRHFLAIRPPRMGPPEVFGRWFDAQPWSRMTAAKQLGVGMHMALSVMCGGTKTFAECDPVW